MCVANDNGTIVDAMLLLVENEYDEIGIIVRSLGVSGVRSYLNLALLHTFNNYYALTEKIFQDIDASFQILFEDFMKPTTHNYTHVIIIIVVSIVI